MAISPKLPDNALQPFTATTDAPERTKRTQRSVANLPHKWPDGVITVALDLRNAKSEALVVDAIREWAHHTPSLRFQIVEGRQGDIRISDDERLEGNWSYIGTHAKQADKNQPTMHLDRTDDSTAFRSIVLHEFGHALGLMHEHQHPENTVDWNTPAVFHEYASESVPDDYIHEQYLDVFSGDGLQVTPYDQRSVMHYHVPAHVRNSGQTIPENTHLSQGDQEAVRRLYTPRLAEHSA
ncbi:M12 family metallopeptidase [Pseudomonas sp. AMR01]|uniref:M12 family metallopeptidase n=1 Tax=Pseudomonas sp. AMR01 TaxID=3064904 RepID=UPI0035C09AFE